MQGVCPLCGYVGEIAGNDNNREAKTCLMCFLRFYAIKQDIDSIGIQTEEGKMGWGDVAGKGGKDPDIITIAPNTTKLMHILLADSEEPVSYWTHYIPNKSPNGPKGSVVICPGKDICPACLNGTYRTKRVHAVNVWDYETKSVKIFEGGNSIFQVLKQIKEQIGSLSTVDISVKKIGTGIETQYSVIPIPMMSPFDISKVGQLFNIAELRKKDEVGIVAQRIKSMDGTPSTGTTIAEVMPATTFTPQPIQQITTPTFNTAPVQGAPILNFGKYKGKTVAEIYTEDQNYIKWCSENISDPTIKAEAKRVIEASKFAPKPAKSVLSEETQKQMHINEIEEMFEMDTRYTGKFDVILEKMREASKSPTHPNGKTLLVEYTIPELEKLIQIIKQ